VSAAEPPPILTRAKRPAARILLVGPDDRILLFRFVPDRYPPFWCTPGGALDPGEDHPTAARRELLEETGIEADCGPEIACRVAHFKTIEGIDVEADERYFLVRTDRAAIVTTGHTELEQRVMREWRWFTREDIAGHGEPIFPRDLLAMLDALGDAR